MKEGMDRKHVSLYVGDCSAVCKQQLWVAREGRWARVQLTSAHGDNIAGQPHLTPGTKSLNKSFRY